jgi:hypothetical protein
MFCRNCGKETPNQGEYCMTCGAKPLAGNSFCPACAAPTTPLSEICVKCGTRLIQSQSAPGISSAPVSAGGKSKTVSILLAVFLGFWTWLYTYKKDHWKFWVSLGVSIVCGLGFGILLVWLMVNSIDSSSSGDFTSFFIGYFIVAGIAGIIGFGLWIWSVIDTAIKKDEWYSGYHLPNK